jgi:hypothetical protein
MISWSEADASDVRIVRTSGRAESFPAQASDRSIEKAKARVASASEQQASEDPSDACNFVPDTFGAADFAPACSAHDACYGPLSSVDRLQCDLLFLQALTAECASAYEFDFARLLTCNAVAGIYFIGVRLFGGFAYQGSGDPA